MVRAARFGAVLVNLAWRRSRGLVWLKVQSSAASAHPPDEVWSLVSDFCAAWHPAVDHMVAERSPVGGLVRKFRVQGDDTIYRERLTYKSDSERCYAYTHIEGIDGVQSYDARLTVAETAEGCIITMGAELHAPSSRAQEIAAGTQVVFDMGVAAIAQLAGSLNVAIETVTVEGPAQLAVSVAGQAGSTVCLFLHGIGGNRTNWDSQLRAVAPQCRAAAMDLRGYGDSRLSAEQSSVEDYCADILRVMDALKADRLVLCGLSYGAWIATSFAMRHPEKLTALVVSGGCTGMSEAGASEREAFRRSREEPLNAGQTPADFAAQVVDVISGPTASDADRATLHRSMAAIPAQTYADALRCFTNPPGQFDFAKLTLPVLLMTGEFDRLAPPAEIKSVAERIWQASSDPDVSFEIIQDAGHVCNLEGAAAYNAHLTAFLGRVLA